ncbi:hypothetical protein IGI39_000240 [Enterococcus sp. AZ135]
MHKEKQSTINDTSHLCQKTEPKNFEMLRPHRQHQFHCDEVHRIMDANARQNNISLHVPPHFQDMQKNC